jgi:hypothetical protein
MRNRWIILALLGFAAAVLVVLWFTVKESRASVSSTVKGQQRPTVSSVLDEQLTAVCAQFGIPGKSIRLRKVSDREGHLLRKEHRIAVPEDFSSFEFNNALSRRVEQYGARIMGTEQSRDRTVTLHVIQDDKTLMSIILELRQELTARKKHGL